MRSKASRCRFTATARTCATGCLSKITARRFATVLETGRPGETYNIGGNSERANIDVVTAICDLVDEMRPQPGARRGDELITYVEDRPGPRPALCHRRRKDCARTGLEAGGGV